MQHITPRQQQIRNLIQSSCKPQHQPPSKKTITILVAALVGTMIGSQVGTLFFSITFIVTFTFAAARYRSWSKPIITTLCLITATSVLSGCSPSWTRLDPDLLAVCEASNSESCRIGVATGWSVFGMTVKAATVEKAKKESGIKNIISARVDAGHGLVAIKKVTIYGT